MKHPNTPLYVSAKRTHFDFDHFPIYEAYRQELTSFAERFANGFVLENEPIFGVDFEVR